jgi:hypothetical protein
MKCLYDLFHYYIFLNLGEALFKPLLWADLSINLTFWQKMSTKCAMHLTSNHWAQKKIRTYANGNQVLAWERHKNVIEINWISILPFLRIVSPMAIQITDSECLFTIFMWSLIIQIERKNFIDVMKFHIHHNISSC